MERTVDMRLKQKVFPIKKGFSEFTAEVHSSNIFDFVKSKCQNTYASYLHLELLEHH